LNRKLGSFLVFLAIVVLVSAVGSRFGAGEWYVELSKPAWNPPAWVFAPVWAALYLLMAISAWQVWNSGHVLRTIAILYWSVQLILNATWSWLFFGLHRPGWAVVELALLIAAVVMTIRKFYLVRPLAAGLLLPYLAWILFAWALNLKLWQMNGGGFSTIFG
jgi:tryptophan-rich sensory protein